MKNAANLHVQGAGSGILRALSAKIFCGIALFALYCPVVQSAPLTAAQRKMEQAIWLNPLTEAAELDAKVSREIQLHPQSAFDHYLLGHLQVRLFTENPGDMALLRRASELGQQAIDLEPTSDYGYVVIAEILDLMGQQPNAFKILDPSLTPALSKSWRADLLIARMEAEHKMAHETLAKLDKALSYPESQQEIITPYIIAVLREEYKGSALVNELDKWYTKTRSSLFLQTQAYTLVDLEQYQRAVKIYALIQPQDTGYVEAKVSHALVLYKHLNKDRDAKTILTNLKNNKSVHKSKDVETMINYHLGTLALRAKQFPEAQKNFIATLQQADDQTLYLDLVGENYKEKKQFKEFAAFLSQLNEQIPGVGVFHAVLGETLSEDLQQHKNALDAFQDAIALEPTRSDYYTGLGLTYYRMNNMNEALNFFSTAVKIDPEDATARYNEACVLARMDQPVKALSSLREALTLNPKLQQTAREDQDFKGMKTNVEFLRLINTPRDVKTGND